MSLTLPIFFFIFCLSLFHIGIQSQNRGKQRCKVSWCESARFWLQNAVTVLKWTMDWKTGWMYSSIDKCSFCVWCQMFNHEVLWNTPSVAMVGCRKVECNHFKCRVAASLVNTECIIVRLTVLSWSDTIWPTLPLPALKRRNSAAGAALIISNLHQGIVKLLCFNTQNEESKVVLWASVCTALHFRPLLYMYVLLHICKFV